jgi:hypothetical protein
MFKRLLLTFATLFVLASLVAACGGATAPTQQPAAQATAAPAAPTAVPTAAPTKVPVNQIVLQDCGDNGMGSDEVAYVSFRPNETSVAVIIGMDDQIFLNDLEKGEEYNAGLGKGEAASIFCGNAELYGKYLLLKRPDKGIWVNGVEITLDMFEPILDGDGKIKSWAKAETEVTPKAAGAPIFYWAYTTQEWLELPVSLTTDKTKFVLGLPKGYRFDHTDNRWNGWVAVVDGYGTLHFIVNPLDLTIKMDQKGLIIFP